MTWFLQQRLVLLHAWSYLLQIGMNTLVPPVGALLLSGLGILWVGEDQLAREQVKGKVNYTICIANRCH